MTALIIGDNERQQIAELKAVAAANPMDARSILDVAKRDLAAFRDMMQTLSVKLPVGYSVCYSQEVQPEAPTPTKLAHHISISVDRSGKLPSPEAVEMILEAFGLQPLKQSHGVWFEDIAPGERAVNVVQLVD